MRFIITVAVLMLPLSVIYAADVPDSIVGEWQLDIIRTTSEHINNITLPNLPTDPYGLTPSQAAEVRKKLPAQASEIDSQLKLTITPETMTFDNASSGTNTYFYKIVGGNSALIVIELSDNTGYDGIGKIRLVTNGIAIERTDCDTYPRQCEFERKRALETMRKNYQQNPGIFSSGSGQSADPTSFEYSQDQSPKLIYFRPVTTK